MPKIIATSIIKGGTGKTTTAAALAQAAAQKKKHVLAIDLDPQGNLSDFLDGSTETPGSYDLLHGTAARDVIQKTAQGIDVITASPDLSTERTSGGSAKRLEKAIEPIKGSYDFIIIDTPPSMGELTFNALQAAGGLLIPLDADAPSVKGLYQIADIAGKIRQPGAGRFSPFAVIVTRYRARANINRYLQGEIEKAAAAIGAAYYGEIRDGIAIREAQAMRKNLFDYAPSSNPAIDYMELFKKIQRGK